MGLRRPRRKSPAVAGFMADMEILEEFGEELEELEEAGGG